MDLNPIKPVLMWRTPAYSGQQMYFRGLKIKDGLYPVPPLIWKISGVNLSLYAYKEWEGEHTRIFNAPFPNTRPAVCLGMQGQHFLSRKVDSVSSPQKIINAAEHIYWNTAFTETQGPTAALWPPLKDADHFPLDQLVDTKKELHQLW